MDNLYICPVCLKKINKEVTLIKNEKSYTCLNNHSFDISKEGYINLLQINANNGDNETLIKAREQFLNKDYYKPLKDKLISILKDLKTETILDCGCGTGYYTEEFSKYFKSIYALDISKYAVKIASKKHNSNNLINYFVASSKQIPIISDSIDAIINIFAPYFNDEFARILKNEKYLIIVNPDKNHLYELKEKIYSNPYYNDNINKPSDKLLSFDLIHEENLSYVISTNNEDLINLFMMTPYYYKTKPSDFEKIKKVDHLDITIDFNILIYKKRQS